jgi:hypothetical protein
MFGAPAPATMDDTWTAAIESTATITATSGYQRWASYSTQNAPTRRDGFAGAGWCGAVGWVWWGSRWSLWGCSCVWVGGVDVGVPVGHPRSTPGPPGEMQRRWRRP